MPDWDAPDVISWKKKARAQQQNIFLQLGDQEWDRWRRSDVETLHLKVGFGLFSLPENLPDVNNPPDYNEEQFEKIKRVSDTILRNAKSGRFISFACIFVFAKRWQDRFVVPVFKVKGDQDRTLFVDSDCRVYNDWQNYLTRNCLKKCMYCYPRDGVYELYEDQVLVDFGTSPACDQTQRICSALDTTATFVHIASTLVLTASLLTVPVAAPIIAVVTTTSAVAGIYGVIRSVTNLVDRKMHDQSISLADSEARKDWLGIVGFGLGFAQNRLYSTIVRRAAAGIIASRALIITFNGLTVGSLAVKGLGTLNSYISLIGKAIKGELTLLECTFHCSISTLSFILSLLGRKTVKGLIENIQREVLNRYCDNLTPPEIEELFRIFDEVPGRTRLERNNNKIELILGIGHRLLLFLNRETDRLGEDDRD